MNEQEKLIEEQKKTLTPNLLRAIDTVPWKTLVQEIGKVNTLNAEQIVSLEQETMFIIYAFEPPEDYIANMIREIGLSEDVASSIAESVAGKIFDPIMNVIETPDGVKSDVPQVIHNNLPMVEKGEVAHTVPHVEPLVPPTPSVTTTPPQPQTKPEPKVSLPDYRYPGGKDPYREPLK